VSIVVAPGPPEPVRRPRMSGEDRRRALLAAARAEFARHGFHGAGTAAIARAAGCSEAILYRHFRSKRALLAEVLRTEIAGRIADDRAMAPPPGVAPGPGALPGVLDARLADAEMGVTARLILLAISMSDDPEVGEAVRGAFLAVRGPLRGAVEALQAAGAIRDDLDPDAVTWLWHGLFLGAAVRQAMAGDAAALGAVDAARVLAALLEPPTS
jgi:AcrR family transcriptional regulator